MWSSNRVTGLRPLLMKGLFLSVLLLTATALAVGRVQWKSTSVKERDDDSWKLELAIYLPKPPDTAHLPVKFEFEPTAYYERAMIEGDKLVERTVPLTDRMPIIESVDVGFLDPGTGKIQTRTKFAFRITRAHGFEAGEYRVSIVDSRSGRKIGAPVTLKLKGENETIDRRPMVFSGEKKKKKKDDADSKPEQTSSEPTQKIDLDAEEPAEEGSSSGSSADSSSGDQYDRLAEDDEPGTIEEKPGGCGCRAAGQTAPNALGLAASLLLGGVLLTRRRRGPRG